jgi:hypothetical protein
MISMLLKARKMALQTETSVAGIKIQKKIIILVRE